MKTKGLIIYFLFLSQLLFTNHFSIAQTFTETRVAVVYNINSPFGREIAEYYASKRNIPFVPYLIGISTTTEEVIDLEYYKQQIRDVLREEINNRKIKTSINYLVTVKGLPLKIRAYDNKCYVNQLRGGSLESFLCTIFSEIEPCSAINLENLYYGQDEVFNSFFQEFRAVCPESKSGKISYLVSRLDAYSKDDVYAMIDRAVNSDISGEGFYVLDTDPTKNYDRMNLAVQNLTALGKGEFIVFDNSPNNILQLPGNQKVIGYCGHGRHANSNPPSIPFMGWYPDIGYLGGANFNWTNGAIFSTYESFNAYSFKYEDNGCPYDNGSGQLLGHVDHQNLLADFIQDGGTLAVGHVYEPFSSFVADESILFDRMLKGHYFIDAAYMSLKVLSFHNLVLGDPLCLINKAIHSPENTPRPESFELLQNFPNPFNSETRIKFVLFQSGFVSLKIFDLLGNEIQNPLNQFMEKGEHELIIKMTAKSSGIYSYQLLFNDHHKVKKMVYSK